jgi:hypothetical protein
MFYRNTRGNAVGVALAVVLGIAGIASADEVHFTGSTLGRFNAQAFAGTNTLLDLVYNNSTFDNTTVNGALDLGGDPTPPNFNNLGSFSLGLTNNTYNGNTFQLMVTFTAPTTITGGSISTFSDILSGTILDGQGGVFVDFYNTPQTFTFSNGSVTGTFTMFINDVSITPGHAASLTGHITASQVPEPAVLAGLVCGMFGFIGIRRTKKA